MYVRVDVPGDGSCMFHAVAFGLRDNSKGINGHVSGHALRTRVVQMLDTDTQISGLPIRQWIEESETISASEYANRMKTAWGGAIELACLSHLVKRCIAVYAMTGSSARKIASFGEELGDPIFILYTGSHYMALKKAS